uniref:Cyclin-dependent kinase 2-interacting protein n=1 Tax=Xenopus tropicalis TaxID=8364 RepID=A0A803KDQ3_XENTR
MTSNSNTQPGVCKSPGYVTPKKPALSASARKIKDNAADWHNLMLKWETYNNDSFTIASKIVNLKIITESADSMLDETTPNKDNITTDKVELDRLCSELLHILENMEKIWTKLEKITVTFKGICDLEAYQFPGDISKPVHFHTWPTTLFYETSKTMVDMYKKEMELKRTIIGDLAHTSDQDLRMVYLSCWLYQPYIDNNIKVLLESMLLETGHRTF